MSRANRTNRQWRLKKRPVGAIADTDLELVETEVPEVPDGHVLVRTVYLSLDPTNRIWMSDMDQYMPPVEIGAVMRGGAIGVVEESRAPNLAPGTLVQAGLGGWQDYQVVHAMMANPVPKIPGLPATAFMSVCGATGLTAYFGLLDIGQPKAGETVVVSAAAGAVGSVAGQLAKLKGARAVGIAGGPDKCAWLREIGFDAAIDYKNEDVGAALDRHCPNGIDVNFENVGGDIMDAVLARMNNFSRMPLCGLISTYNDLDPDKGPRNFKEILMKRINVRGFIVIDYLPRFAEGAQQLAQWALEGKLKYKVHVVDGLENAVSAVRLLFSGAHDGKLLVQVSPEPA